MALPEEFLEELRYRNPLDEVISSYIDVRRRGKNMVGLCPFHGEKTPSFTVYTENNSFYCFGCGAGGDVITFIRKIENLDYLDAVRFLAQRAGMNMPENQMDSGLSKLRLRVYEANRALARYFYSTLYSEKGKPGYEYLHGKRKLTDQTIRRFGLGFAANEWDGGIRYLRAKGFDMDELVAADLVYKTQKGSYIDKYRNKVMFPIIDVRGNVVGFGSRVMDNSKPKYVNTSDTIVFKKTYQLYALNLSKNNCKKRLILAEGYMDVIALHQAGFDYAVATLGTALTREQANMIARYTDEVVICYDSDEAGQKATQKAIDIFSSTGVRVRVMTVTDGKDPDGYIREKGAAAFERLLDGAGNDIEYALLKARQKYAVNTADGKVAYLKDAVRILAALHSPIEQDVYSAKLAEEFSVDRQSILSQVKSQQKRRQKTVAKKEMQKLSQDMTGYHDSLNPEKGQHLRAARAEEGLLAALLAHPEHYGQIKDLVCLDDFVTQFHRKVYSVLSQRLENGQKTDLSSLSSEFQVEEMGRLAGFVHKSQALAHNIDEIHDYIRVIQEEKERGREAELSDMSPEELSGYFANLAKRKQ